MKVSFDELYSDYFLGWEFDLFSFGYGKYLLDGMKENKHITIILFNFAMYIHFGSGGESMASMKGKKKLVKAVKSKKGKK
jgi:hypothetical protein